jgi:catechol 2,3-dioxygenase-like lactoylglutathione lyase family enzyme
MPEKGPVISVMLAVPDAPAAVDWYTGMLGATLLWSLGSVARLDVAGAPVFVGQPERNGWESRFPWTSRALLTGAAGITLSCR